MSRRPLVPEGSDHYISVIAGRLRAVTGYCRDMHPDDREILLDLAAVVASLPPGSLTPMREMVETRRRRHWQAEHKPADSTQEGSG